MRSDKAEDESEGSEKSRRKSATNEKGIVCNSCGSQTKEVRAANSAGRSERQAIVLPVACSKYTIKQACCQGFSASLPAPQSAQKPKDGVYAAPGQGRAKQALLTPVKARGKKSAERPLPAHRSVCARRAGAAWPRPGRARSAAGTTWRQERRHRRAHRIACSTTQARQRHSRVESAAGNMPAHLRAQARNTGKGASRRAAEETTPILSPCHLYLS